MRYGTPAAFRAGLSQLLKPEAERRGVTTTRLRKHVAFELFLRRLIAVARDRWVLKGAFAFDLRFGVATRPTKDIDLGRDDDVDAAIEDIIAAQQLDLGDYFSFSATRTDAFADPNAAADPAPSRFVSAPWGHLTTDTGHCGSDAAGCKAQGPQAIQLTRQLIDLLADVATPAGTTPRKLSEPLPPTPKEAREHQQTEDDGAA